MRVEAQRQEGAGMQQRESVCVCGEGNLPAFLLTLAVKCMNHVAKASDKALSLSQMFTQFASAFLAHFRKYF